MARYVKGNDSTGWKRGSAPHSRSYPKVSTTPPPGFAGHYPAPTESAQRMGNTGSSTKGALPTVQDLIRGVDIYDRVAAHDGKVNTGLSGELSRNKRPRWPGEKK